MRTWDKGQLRDSHAQCVRVDRTGSGGGGGSDSLQQVKTLLLLLLLHLYSIYLTDASISMHIEHTNCSFLS